MALLAVARTATAQCTSVNTVSCCGDLDGDEVVTWSDVALVLSQYGDCGGCCTADVDFDGEVGQSDLSIVLGEWGDPNDPNNLPKCVGARPLHLTTWPDNANDPKPLPVGEKGASFADVDADGYPDAFIWYKPPSASYRRALFFNDIAANPAKWNEGCLIAGGISESGGYGVSAGDYNNDGFPDYSNEPRGGDFLFLVNAGCGVRCDPNSCGSSCNEDNQNFVSAATCLQIDFDGEKTETNAWGDLDGDGRVDLLVTAYHLREPIGGGGPHATYFFRNIGYDPNDPPCPSVSANCQSASLKVWGMVDATTSANLGTIHPDVLNRPEGTQLLDYDSDGDLDVFVQDCVRQNVTQQPGSPLFQRLLPNDSGIEAVVSSGPEEGLLLVDIDMDGDLDLFRNPGGALYVNASQGDGTFFAQSGVASPAGWGVSSADWDNDGDLDVTAGGRWLRNQRIEGWAHTPPIPIIYSIFQEMYCPEPNLCNPDAALPSWADVDRDGDLDCARSVFSDPTNAKARLYRNALYFATCDESKRRYVTVRPVRAVTDPNGPALPNARDFTENEFGARVELMVRGDDSGVRRVQATSAAAGYLTQNEYLLHFGLPPDPDPNDHNEDLHFDVFVDFVKPLPEGDAAEGPWRIDWTVNEALADINLAELYPDPNDPSTWGRPITVYRDGRVRYSGQVHDPIDPNTGDPNGVSPARLYNLCGPLLLPEPNGGGLIPVTSGNYLAGVRFTKQPNTPAVRVREFIVDGQVDGSTSGCAYNIAVVDVTDPNNPSVIGVLLAATVSHNRRTFIPVPPDPNNAESFVLPEASTERKYDVRVRLTSYRLMNVPDDAGLPASLGISLDGGLALVASSGKNICSEPMSVQASKPTQTPVTVRLSRKAEPSP